MILQKQKNKKAKTRSFPDRADRGNGPTDDGYDHLIWLGQNRRVSKIGINSF